jgi:DNA-binding transcriptional regulator GbsR (MarR family)
VKAQAHNDAINQFILYWGEMAPAWGINKTMAQIHALLYAEEDAMDTDQIMSRLEVSRGNANMNLRSLVTWGLVQIVSKPGSRKDYYTAEKDVWEIAAIIIRERRHRELGPVRENLQECLDILGKENDKDAQTEPFRERIDDFIKFLDVVNDMTTAMLPFITSKKSASLKSLLMLMSTLKGRKKSK